MESSTRRRPLVIKPKFDRNNIYVLCGSAAVGKSCILRRFHDGVFSRHQKATIGGENFIEYLTDTYRATGAFRSKIMRVDGSLIQVQVWDTSGQERFQSICPIYYRKAQAAIIVYDISRYETYAEAKKYYEDVEFYAPPDCIKILVGNKIDLSHMRQVNRELAERYCRPRGIIHFETSAKDDINVDEMFVAIARTVPHKEERRRETVVPKRNDVPKKPRLLDCLFSWIKKL